MRILLDIYLQSDCKLNSFLHFFTYLISLSVEKNTTSVVIKVDEKEV